MTLQEQLKDIKTQLRLAMNGVVSKSMRDKGLDYKLNFGVELPRLKEIAARYPQNHQLAQALWKEQVRESKILAALLQPVDEFIPELADMWVEEMNYPEIAELTSMHLFQHLPYASAKVFEWIADERPYFQACGYLVLTRMFMRGMQLNERAEQEFLDQAIATVCSAAAFPRRTATVSLLKYAAIGEGQREKTLRTLRMYSSGEEAALAALVDELEALEA